MIAPDHLQIAGRFRFLCCVGFCKIDHVQDETIRIALKHSSCESMLCVMESAMVA